MPLAPCGAPVKAVQRGLSIILMQFMEAARLKFGARVRGAHQTALASAPISALSPLINTGPRARSTPGISAIPLTDVKWIFARLLPLVRRSAVI